MVNKDILIEKVALINTLLDRDEKHQFVIEYIYHRPRLIEYVDHGVHIWWESMSATEMDKFIVGFINGISATRRVPNSIFDKQHPELIV